MILVCQSQIKYISQYFHKTKQQKLHNFSHFVFTNLLTSNILRNMENYGAAKCGNVFAGLCSD